MTRTPEIDADRLWEAHRLMAEIGPIPGGGSRRLALSPEDAAARALLLDWTRPLGLAYAQDAIGNMFFRREGTAPAEGAVAFGSHLDTVPEGGRFDGVSGVLCALEVMRALHEAGVTTRRPLELVNWTNEEGSRFRPAMMGSRVFAADMSLKDALAVRDNDGISVEQALKETGQAGPLAPSPRGWSAWLELHIEQGPVMEATGTDIGVVTGTMHARYLQLTVHGEPSHGGATAMERRHDALAAVAEAILAIERIGIAAEPRGRSAASWIENEPNARGSVPNLTRLSADVRHEDPEAAIRMEAEVKAALEAIATRRKVRIELDPYATFGPTVFDAGLCSLLRQKAEARQLSTRDMVAAAGHDSVLVNPLCPSAMLFVPCKGGITHNPAEYASKEQLARGAQVLLDAVLTLAK
ncbi:MAG: hydantoinase/carbamoylase family amidase [Rhodospirillales bacterium]|nr:hydantoinase/carbamoylase family amidase [Rhodospirillales bacterium]